jgi:uncharacterized protein
MDFPRIIEQLGTSVLLPKTAILAALAEPEAFVPKAVEILERQAAGAPLSSTEENAIMLIIHVLGELGDTRGLGPLIDLLATSSDELDRLLGDSVGETVPGILMRLAADNIALVEEVVINPRVDQFARWSIFAAWIYFVLEGRIERDAARTFLAGFPGRGIRAGLGKDDVGWAGWVEAVANLQFHELAPIVEAFFSEGYLAPDEFGGPIDIDDFHEMLDEAENAQDRNAWMVKNGYVPFNDTIGTLSDWYGYSEDYLMDVQDQMLDDEFEEARRALTIATNPNRSVGRNDPCPCGSGKKYKKCCLQ